MKILLCSALLIPISSLAGESSGFQSSSTVEEIRHQIDRLLQDALSREIWAKIWMESDAAYVAPRLTEVLNGVFGAQTKTY